MPDLRTARTNPSFTAATNRTRTQRRLKRVVVLLIVALALVAGLSVPASPRARNQLASDRELVIRRDLQYGVTRGERLLLDAYLVPGQAARPAVVFVHGGGFRAGDKAFVAPGQQPFTPIGTALAGRGFAVFAINYRLAPRFRYPAAERDVLAAVGWVRGHAHTLGVDPGRIALFGASAGANLAALAATDPKGALDRGTRVRAVVSWSGPMDLASFYAGHSFVGDYLGCIPSDCPRRYLDASPVSHVDRSDPPFLLANGSAEIVPLVQAQRMARRLRGAHVAHELIVVPGSRHAGEYATQVWRSTLRFLARHLRP
ncbi:MAG: alpha/beta hydrolase [Actinomycetota bacterium]|nr:alpha/beta hydrolase [Actinomycetota bacterium]